MLDDKSLDLSTLYILSSDVVDSSRFLQWLDLMGRGNRMSSIRYCLSLDFAQVKCVRERFQP